MARPVRIRVAGGLHHVCARGHDRQALFTDRRDYAQFLELIEEMHERFRVRGYAYGPKPKWLDSGILLRRAGGTEKYRRSVEERIRQGTGEGFRSRVRWGLVLGGERGFLVGCGDAAPRSSSGGQPLHHPRD